MTYNARTVQDVADYLAGLARPRANTVDGLRSGSPSAEVKRIGVAFMPSYAVLRKAREIGVQMLIAHEGESFSHRDRSEALRHDPVYQEKARLLEESGIALYRFHDGPHDCRPDLIAEGLAEALNWKAYVREDAGEAFVLEVPEMTLREIVDHVKRKLRLTSVRVAGDLSMPCSRIGLAPGYRGGGEFAISLLESRRLELLVTGEGPEWETPEYVNDAAAQGRRNAVILLGHAASEEPGMRLLAERLRAAFPELSVDAILGDAAIQTL